MEGLLKGVMTSAGDMQKAVKSAMDTQDPEQGIGLEKKNKLKEKFQKMGEKLKDDPGAFAESVAGGLQQTTTGKMAEEAKQRRQLADQEAAQVQPFNLAELYRQREQ